MNPHVPGAALGLFFLGTDPSQVCNAGGPAALDEVRLHEGLLAAPLPAPLGLRGLRGLTMMRVLAALNVAGGALGLRHPAASSLSDLTRRGSFR